MFEPQAGDGTVGISEEALAAATPGSGKHNCSSTGLGPVWRSLGNGGGSILAIAVET